MAIAIKSFSPLQNTGTYLLDDVTPALMFTGNSDKYYYAVMRRVSYDRYDWLYQGLMVGYDNGTGYDYKLSLDKFIKFHDNFYYGVTVISPEVVYLNIPTNEILSELVLLISTDNIIEYNDYYINTDSNGVKWTANNDMYLINATEGKTYYRFNNVKQPQGVNVLSELYTDSWLPILLPPVGFRLEYLSYWDKDSNYVGDYGFEDPISLTPDNYKLVFSRVPRDAETASLIYYNLNQQTYHSVDLQAREYCARNQYFYRGDNIIDCISCTGKREQIKESDREYIKSGNRNLLMSNKIKTKYEQNTGFSLKESELMGLSKANYLMELEYPSNTFKYYNLLNSEYKAYNTRSLSMRNDVLLLEDLEESKRYVSPINGFFD